MSLAEVGLEPASLDRSVDPCGDFFQYACGGWLKATEIPADKARWGRFSEIDAHNKVLLKQLLEDDAKRGGDANAKKLGDYYASCMDEAAIEKAGTKGIKPLLDKATNVKDNESWFPTVAELHKAGIGVVFRQGAREDFLDSANGITLLDSGGLGLPDRDYYLEDKFKSKLDAYTAHVGGLLDEC